MVYGHDMKCRQICRPTQASRMLGRLVSANNAKFWYIHGSWFHVACVPCLSGAVWSGLPCDVLPVHLTWPSQMALTQQAHCLQMALELRCLYAQALPHLPWPALSWCWWVTNSFYVGSGCAPPHPWGISHRLVHWGRATFPPHIPFYIISSVFYGSPWRQLHGLGLYPPPPR